MIGNPPTPKHSSWRSPTMPRSGSAHVPTLEDRDHVLRCPSQGRTRYLELQDIRGSISETKSPAGPVLWEGLKHWLSNSSEPLPIDTSRYSRRTKLLVQQALHEQERVGWDFRGYLSLTWGLLEAPHEVPNPYNKTPQSSAWVLSTLTNFGTFSKAICGKTAARNYMTPITPPLQHPILMRILPTAIQTLKTFSPLTASYSIALSRRSSNPNALTKPNFFAVYAAPIVTFSQSDSNGSILYAISSTRQFPLLHSLILTFVFHKLYS
jgi:hypothetical protein